MNHRGLFFLALPWSCSARGLGQITGLSGHESELGVPLIQYGTRRNMFGN